MKHTSSNLVQHPLAGPYGQTAFVFQGGGALGSYQPGVYQALSEAGFEPDWLAATSIGSINSAIIAGNEPSQRLSRLREFWERCTTTFPWPTVNLGDTARRVFEQASGMSSMLFGQTGFFEPRYPPAILLPHGAPGSLSVYDTSPLRRTLEELVDFDRINDRKTRLSLGAANVRRGDLVYFDNSEREITVDHVMASAALPPGFPPVEIEGEFYWDGGVVSNTPLVEVLDNKLEDNTLVFQVDLFNSQGNLPGNLLEVEQRRKHINFSSRTQLNTSNFREKYVLRQAIMELFEALPPQTRDDDKFRELSALGDNHNVSIVHLVRRRAIYDSQDSDYEFSRRSMREHWNSGLHDGRRALRNTQWETNCAGLKISTCDGFN